MTLKEIYYKKNKIVISFEIFPPKNDEDGTKLEKLLNHLRILKKYNPALVSLTYGAGGTTQDASLNIIKKIKNKLDLTVMPHFTCVGSSAAHVENYLNEIKSLGIENILALRGDIPEGILRESFDFHYANELVSFIKLKTQFSIAVAGYPEGHIECSDLDTDLKHLKLKIDAGANVIYTQMFFDNEKYFKFIDSIQKQGIETPVIPGILPIMNFNQLEKMLSMAKVTLPATLMGKLEKYKDKPDEVKKIGIDFASNQCQELIDSGASGLHFFTLNTSFATSTILDNLLFLQKK
jgi:methylenetetrahydrofolate reductase (NADPH)